MMRSALISLSRRTLIRSSTLTASRSPLVQMMSTKTSEVEGGLNPEQLRVLNEMFTKIDSLETQVTTLQARVRELETFGVDAPDGESDAELAADLHVVEEYIEGAAENEDTKFINQKHKLQQDVQKFHARDPEHDW